MTTFVLVHGAWGGGWAWRTTVGALLRDAGQEVFTPTLTGLGERAHLATPDTDLDTHIQDIVNVLEYEDLRDVILLGHSYGGMVITGVADRVPDRLAHLLYADAFVPCDGQAVSDLTGESPARMAERADDGWRLPPRPLAPDTPPAQRAWIEPRRLPQPVKTFTQPLRLSGTGGADLRRAYILCTQPVGEAFARVGERVRADAGWRYVEFPTSHNLHYTMPRELANLLLELAV